MWPVLGTYNCAYSQKYIKIQRLANNFHRAHNVTMTDPCMTLIYDMPYYTVRKKLLGAIESYFAPEYWEDCQSGGEFGGQASNIENNIKWL